MNRFESRIRNIRNRIENISDVIDFIESLKLDMTSCDAVQAEFLYMIEFKLMHTCDEIDDIRKMLFHIKETED